MEVIWGVVNRWARMGNGQIAKILLRCLYRPFSRNPAQCELTKGYTKTLWVYSFRNT